MRPERIIGVFSKCLISHLPTQLLTSESEALIAIFGITDWFRWYEYSKQAMMASTVYQLNRPISSNANLGTGRFHCELEVKIGKHETML